MGSEIISVHIAETEAANQASLLDTVTHSGPLAFCVLLLLVGFSIVSWGIILVKWLAIRQASRSSCGFLEIFWQSKRLDEIFSKTDAMPNAPLAQVFRAGYQELVKVKQREQKEKSAGEEKAQVGSGVENVERALRRAATSEMTELERLIPFLA